MCASVLHRLSQPLPLLRPPTIVATLCNHGAVSVSVQEQYMLGTTCSTVHVHPIEQMN